MAVGIPNLVEVGEWLEEESLLLLEGWARDGATLPEIADKIGINRKTLVEWRKKYPEINNALRGGFEVTNFRVENALLKSALGYKTKEVKVTTVMRFGKVVETRSESTEKEIAPNPSSAQFWLINRLPEKWKKSRDNLIEIDEEDSNIKITVTRASSKQEQKEDQDSDWENIDDMDDGESTDEEWDAAINETVEITPMTQSEYEESKRQKQKLKRENKRRQGN